MMAVIRLIYDFFRKEELIAFDYIRKHPHTKWLIGLDAVITVSLVFGGFAYASQSTRGGTSEALLRVGAVAMTTSEFMAHAHLESGREYWLGPRSGFGISSNDSQKDVRAISYIKDSSEYGNFDRHQVTVVTYRGSIDTAGIQQFGTSLEPSTSVTASGIIVKYDPSSMLDEVISINGTFNVVSIHYAVPQTHETLMSNAMALRVVQ